MQLTTEGIRKLSEAELRRTVLIPLFEAMGFQDVRELHGVTELGKDIVMWQSDAIRSRMNIAVVAKRGKISAGRKANDVAGQVRQALGSEYEDPVTLRNQCVDRVIVVTSGEITPGARQSLRAQLDEGRTEGRVDFWDMDSLYDRLRKHVPNAVIWEALRRARDLLRDASEKYDFTLQVGPTGNRLFASERPLGPEDFEPLEGKVSFFFPATPEGEAKKRSYERFLEEGEPVILTEENIQRLELPELLRTLAGVGQISEVRMGPSPLDEPLLKQLAATDSSGKILGSLEYLEFSHVYGGTETGSMDNRTQPIPFRIRVTLNKRGEGGKLHLQFDQQGANVFQYLKWLNWLTSAASAENVCLVDWQSGLVDLALPGPQMQVEAPPEAEIEFAKRLVVLQQRTKARLSLPGVNPFPIDQVLNAEVAYSAVTSGFSKLPTGRIRFSVHDPTPWMEQVGESVGFQVSEEAFHLSLFGSEVSLGRANILCQGVLQQAADEKEPIFILESSPEAPFVAAFLDWLPTAPTEAPAVDKPESEVGPEPASDGRARKASSGRKRGRASKR